MAWLQDAGQQCLIHHTDPTLLLLLLLSLYLIYLFLQLLVKLLPALVQKLSTPQPKTRAKTLELLNHINKRVKALPGTGLPLVPLVSCD